MLGSHFIRLLLKIRYFFEVEAGLKNGAYTNVCEHFYFRPARHAMPNEKPVLSLTKGSEKITDF